METEQKIEETNKKEQEDKDNSDFFIQFSNIKSVINSDKNLKDKRKNLRGKKKAMVNAIVKHLGVVSRACNSVGITNNTHYRWLKEDKRYADAIEQTKELVEDIMESAFQSLAFIDKNPQALIHIAKTKLRHRGYGDYIVTEEVGKKDNKLIVEIVNTNNENKDNQSISDERGSSETE